MISRDLIKLLAPHLSLGEERKFNHEGCKAGVDTKHRLYIKRVVGGKLAYCHHCNEHGFVRENNSDGTMLRRWLFGKEETLPRVVATTGCLDKLLTITHPKLFAWLVDHHIHYPPKANFAQTTTSELAFVLRNLSGTPCGYQARSFKATGPKYKTYLESPIETSWFGATKFPIRMLVITEDFTSAYRVWSDVGITSLALLKTSISTNTLNEIIALSLDDIIVWLDPDKPGRDASRKLVARLRTVTTANVCRMDAEEPKNLTPKRVQELLHGL